MNKDFSLMIHGGCGYISDKEQYAASLTDILEKGRAYLAAGKSALDTAEYCGTLLEDDPLYNAGKGSVLNEDGDVELDASIMDGRDLSAGAITCVKGVKNPIMLARRVMEKSEHVLLCGEGAVAFGKMHGIAMERDEYFVTEHRKNQLKQAQKRGDVELDHSACTEEKLGTIGVVARDMQGNLAAATSTGGLTNKKFGRVGDSPIIGAGVFADNETCAVSVTGVGEHALRTSLAKEVDFHMRDEDAVITEAIEKSFDYFERKIKGVGGVIAIDRNGGCGVTYATESIIAGYIEHGGSIQLV